MVEYFYIHHLAQQAGQRRTNDLALLCFDAKPHSRDKRAAPLPKRPDPLGLRSGDNVHRRSQHSAVGAEITGAVDDVDACVRAGGGVPRGAFGNVLELGLA